MSLKIDWYDKSLDKLIDWKDTNEVIFNVGQDDANNFPYLKELPDIIL